MLDQIGEAPFGHVQASWIFAPFDMVVDMALESTEANSPLVPTPD